MLYFRWLVFRFILKIDVHLCFFLEVWVWFFNSLSGRNHNSLWNIVCGGQIYECDTHQIYFNSTELNDSFIPVRVRIGAILIEWLKHHHQNPRPMHTSTYTYTLQWIIYNNCWSIDLSFRMYSVECKTFQFLSQAPWHTHEYIRMYTDNRYRMW